jgi:RNA recognition motif-containing protein
MNPRLYVGNLPPSLTEADLRLLFSRVGDVTEVQLVLDPTTHQSRGYAFVTMASPELAAAALNALHSYSLGGRYIVVTEARPPQEPKGLISAGFDPAPASPYRRGSQRHKSGRRSSRFSRPRGARGRSR